MRPREMRVTSLSEACERLESEDKTLRELKLDHVDARLVRALSRPTHLESLMLHHVELDRDVAGALAKQKRLTELVLDNVHLSDGAASHLAAALQEMTSLGKMTIYTEAEDDVKPVLVVVAICPRFFSASQILTPSIIRCFTFRSIQ